MPTMHSPPRSRSEHEETTETSTTDWSTNTPTESRTAASTSTCIAPLVRPAVAAPPARSVATAGRYTASVRRTTRAAAAAAAAAATATAASHADDVHPARPDVSTASSQRKLMTVTPKNIGGPPEVPPCVSSDTLVPPPAPRSTTKSTKRMELEARRELLKRQAEAAQAAVALAQAEVELVQYLSEEELEDEYDVEKSTQVERWVEQTTTYVEEPKQIDGTIQKSEIRELADAIANAVRTVQPATTLAPPKYAWVLPDFNGAYEEWLPFKRAYTDSSAMYNQVHNMARLRKAIKGTAKEAVRSLLFVASDPEEVMTALERRFGRPEQLVLAEMEKLKELPRVSDTPRDICIFASKVDNAVTTISVLNKPHYLFSPEMSKCIIEKLPPILRYRWYDYSARNSEDPELIRIKKFLNIEADLCGTFAPPETSRKRIVNQRYPVHAARDSKEDATKPTEMRKKSCGNCGKEHWITECEKFREATTNERWEIAKEKHLCFRCLRRRHIRMNCRGQACKKCNRPHHTMLHSDLSPHTTASAQQEESSSNHSADSEDSNTITKPVYVTADETKVYLKMIPVDIYGPNGSARVIALLDEGSTVTLLDSELAAHLGATGKQETLAISTIGGRLIEKRDSQRMDLKIKGAHRSDKRTLKGVRTVGNLQLAPQYVNKSIVENCKHLKEMVDELLYECEKPALLIGQDNWDLIVSRKILKGKPNEPVASLTSLGWVLHGRCSDNIAPVNFVNHCRTIGNEENIEEMIKRHFDLDSIGIQQRRPSNDADGRALALLNETTRQLPEGRYESGLLWKTDTETLPNNYAQAYNRLLGVEKKLDKNPALKEEYGRQLEHLLASGYAEEAPVNSTLGRTFYLPHFAVVHPTKKKIRIVFDAAARFDGKCLNDALLPGPDLLQSLFGVLLRFRQGPVAVVADIKEMFLQIRIRAEDRDSIRYLWRGEDRNKKPKEYRMTSVIFGAASSPATAIFVKNINAQKHEEQYPDAAKAIVRNHYMDDYLQSFATVEEASKIAEDVSTIHKAAGFELRQWASNRKEILQRVVGEEKSPNVVSITSNEEKTLGLRWLANEDMIAFNIGLRNTPNEVSNGNRIPTKREVTSAVMSTFDPMGLVAPVLIQGKRLIQDTWRTGTKWDETINEEQHQLWLDYLEQVKTLQNLKIPRCLAPATKEGQLHTFVDASETAYAAASYWRTVTATGEIYVTLIAGKARVTPVKRTSIPRLELQAALLGARLAATITTETDLEITERVFWSDSSTVLQWMKSDPRRFKPFVAHRLAELEDLSKPCEWRWVPTRDNPADDATRDTPKGFCSESRWFIGPTFLQRPESEWPVKRFEEIELTGEEKKLQDIVATVRTERRCGLPEPKKFSKWTRLLRATARVFMFLSLCRRNRALTNTARHQDGDWKPYQKKEKKTTIHQRPKTKEIKEYLPIQREHLQKAETALIKMSQEESFQEEISRIKKKLPLEKSSKLKKLDVLLDEEGVLRLNSRTMKITNIGDREKEPVILDGRHEIAHLLIDHYHRHFYHGNHATLINQLRQKYWILSLRSSVKKIVHQCQWCRVKNAKRETPPIGDLPAERLQHHSYPFTCTAVDYFGPMFVTIGRRKEKRWGALFTCLTTRAVHLELAPSLSTSSMIMALRRMAARRGSPRIIYSDNGTNFVGADRELRAEAQKIQKQEMIELAEREGIQWKFIPPGAPNMGGAWERLVRTVKVALSAVLNERNPPEEVLHTLLIEVEHTVNSRPLTHLSADPRDEESLTPNHFLLGRSCGSAVLGEFSDTELVGKANWKTAQRLADHFWKRWLREYLPTLMPRKLDGRKTTDPQRGDIVIIADTSLPRNTWPRGEVINVYVGPDGRTRIVDVRTTGGVLRRPTSRLIIVVPAASSQSNVGVPDGTRTGGETVATPHNSF